jgi:hypothetical protein
MATIRSLETAMLPLTLAALICTLLSGAAVLLGGPLFGGALAKFVFAVAAAVFAACLYCQVGGGRSTGWSRRHFAYRDIDLY